MKKAFQIISKILVWLIVIVAVGMMIFTIVSVNTFDQKDRDIFGYKMFIVQSDSMAATHFDAGDLIVIESLEIAEAEKLQVGDVITYQSQNTVNAGEIVTHMIGEVVTTETGRVAYRTYGTTTGNYDELPVTAEFVLGRYSFSIPKLGHFFAFLKTTPGYIVCILVPFLLLIGYQGINCVKIFRVYKKEQMDELQAEKDAIAEERKKSEEMMAELLALKAQLEGKSQTATPEKIPEQAEAEPTGAEADETEETEEAAEPATEQPQEQTPEDKEE